MALAYIQGFRSKVKNAQDSDNVSKKTPYVNDNLSIHMSLRSALLVLLILAELIFCAIPFLHVVNGIEALKETDTDNWFDYFKSRVDFELTHQHATPSDLPAFPFPVNTTYNYFTKTEVIDPALELTILFAEAEAQRLRRLHNTKTCRKELSDTYDDVDKILYWEDGPNDMTDWKSTCFETNGDYHSFVDYIGFRTAKVGVIMVQVSIMILQTVASCIVLLKMSKLSSCLVTMALFVKSSLLTHLWLLPIIDKILPIPMTPAKQAFNDVSKWFYTAVFILMYLIILSLRKLQYQYAIEKAVWEQKIEHDKEKYPSDKVVTV